MKNQKTDGSGYLSLANLEEIKASKESLKNIRKVKVTIEGLIRFVSRTMLDRYEDGDRRGIAVDKVITYLDGAVLYLDKITEYEKETISICKETE